MFPFSFLKEEESWPIVDGPGRDVDEVWRSLDQTPDRGDFEAPYVARARIGSGAQGSVELISVGNTSYVLKESKANQPGQLYHILNEINLFCRFKHPYLARARNVRLKNDGDSYVCQILMEPYISLSDLFRQYPLLTTEGFESGYPWLLRLEIIYTLIDALAFLQDNNVIYGDLGVRNLVFRKIGDETGYRYATVLIDYGRYYRTGCGSVVETQSQTDLTGYRKRGFSRVAATLEGSEPLTDKYNVLADSMWALGLTIMHMTVRFGHLRRDPAGTEYGGPSQYHYDILHDPKHFEQSVYQPFRKTLVPLLKKLTRSPVDRPCYFRDLLKYRLFTVDTDIADRLGRAKGTVRNIDDIRPDYQLNIGKEAEDLFADFCGQVLTLDEKAAPSVSLAAEYFYRLGRLQKASDESDHDTKQFRQLTILREAAASLVLACATLGFSSREISLETIQIVIDDILNDRRSAKVVGVTGKDLPIEMAVRIPYMVASMKGVTQWKVPYFEDSFTATDGGRWKTLVNIVGGRAGNHYQTITDIVTGAGAGLVNEESSPEEGTCQNPRYKR